ncbi:plasmid stabilization protein [Clostridium sp. C8]|nr:plasmid stabilization protein [Clostridium sp. C8]
MKHEMKTMQQGMQTMHQDINALKVEQQRANEKLDRIENKIDITYDQVARSAEDVISIKSDLNFVEEVTARNCNDIEKLRGIK